MKSEDIAKLAGVSRATVSRVINGKSDVSPATRERIQQIIKEHNFIPDQSARKLVGKTPQVLGLFIRNRLAKYEDNLIPWSSHEIPYFGSLILAVISEAKNHGYAVMVSIVDNTTDLEDMGGLFFSGAIAGGILLGFSEQVPKVEEIIQAGYPVALVDQKREDTHSNVILSNVDDFTGGYMATQYLIDRGYRKIAHVCGNPHIVSAQLRKEGYLSCLKDNCIPIYPEYLLEGAYDEHVSYRAVLDFLKKFRSSSEESSSWPPFPEAIFFANDIMAVGGCRAFTELGIQVPRDIAFIGYDGYSLDWVLGKPFTSLKSSLDNLGGASVRLLVEYIRTGEPVDHHREKPEIVLGGTVGVVKE